MQELTAQFHLFERFLSLELQVDVQMGGGEQRFIRKRWPCCLPRFLGRHDMKQAAEP